jgi:hypothetical protein
MALRLVQFLAIMLTALALVPSGAHLAALPNKMAMAQEAYFIAQQIYAGWALFGIVLFGALAANLAHTIDHFLRAKRDDQHGGWGKILRSQSGIRSIFTECASMAWNTIRQSSLIRVILKKNPFICVLRSEESKYLFPASRGCANLRATAGARN